MISRTTVFKAQIKHKMMYSRFFAQNLALLCTSWAIPSKLLKLCRLIFSPKEGSNDTHIIQLF